MHLDVEVEYYDAAPGTLGLEFDGNDASAPFNGAYTRNAEVVQLTGSKSWKRAQFHLQEARFLNSQNRGADFRLIVAAPELYIGRVTLTRP